MCGIAGFLQPGGFPESDGKRLVDELSSEIVHRGPDDCGAWVDGDVGIAFGHQRLSVLDLSPAGRQPMASPSGRYLMVFNGEIYNHLNIREQIERRGLPCPWRGTSDTETLLSAFDQWGIDAVLKKSTGMFAFALWDRKERTLTLARDRIGEKPLYYGWQGKVFLFGSELKVLRRHPCFRADIDRAAVARYMRSGYIGAPNSVYEDIYKLLPGSYLQVSADDDPRSTPETRTYWSLRDVAESGMNDPFAGDDEAAVNELEMRLKEAISLQSVADVPLGAFLSGGTDSATVVALMQAQSSRPVKTFSIGFHESGYDEAEHALAVSRHLGTDHTEAYVTPADAMEIIPSLPALYDEPFGDSSAIPTLLVSRLARQQVTVSLSGDGGDELFGGYRRYQHTNAIWDSLTRVPYFLRKAVARGLDVVPERLTSPAVARKRHRLARYLTARKPEDCYQVQMSQRHDEQDLVLGSGSEPSDTRVAWEAPRAGFFETMMYIDSTDYLPDDILVKLDRAAMAVSLETRVPMLDRHVVEFAWRLPPIMKIRNGEGKWLLKQVLRRYVPPSLTERPKMGFGIPVGQWIAGPLRDWAEELVSGGRLTRGGLLDPRIVRRQWSQHIAGESVSGDSLWSVLMFQAWLSAVTEN